MEESFRVSKDLMKVVSADTRTEILKALENRQMTASELSRFLDKHVTTVSEHLDLLNRANLIERIERPGRKWIYYKLSGLGRQMLHPQPYKIILVLTLSFLSFGLGMYFIPSTPHSELMATTANRVAAPSMLGAAPQPQVSLDHYLLVSGLLIVVSLVGIVYSLVKIRKDYTYSRLPELQ